MSNGDPRRPSIPLLEVMCRRLRSRTSDFLRDVRVVCVQHLLETTVALCDSLLSLGARPDRIHFLGKPYSNSPEVARRLRARGVRVSDNRVLQAGPHFSHQFQADVTALWESVSGELSTDGSLKSVVIVDDGGYCLAGMPRSIPHRWPTVGVEVTTSGLRRPDLPHEIPIVQVASSAAKLHIEAPMISRAVFTKLRPFVDVAKGGKLCGIVGMGSIGRAVARDLARSKNEVLVYDRDPLRMISISGMTWSGSMIDLLSRADYVFGCTGEDIFTEVGDVDDWLRALKGSKMLVSCSSGDTEFRSLLNALDDKQRRTDALATIEYRSLCGTLTIVRGGFPVNFDGSLESVPANDIQMTLGLWFGGVVQAILCGGGIPSRAVNRVMLDPYIQKFVVEEWLARRPSRRRWYPRETLDCIRRPDWIREQSSGDYRECETLRRIFEVGAKDV